MTPSSPRPVLLSLVALVLVAVGGLAAITAAAPAEAKPVQRGTLRVTNATVPAGGRIALYGKIKMKSERSLKVQRRQGTTWVTVVKSRTDKHGRYSVEVVTPGEAGTVTYRVLVPKYALISSRETSGTKKYAATVTAPLTVTLTSVAPASPSSSPSPSLSPSASASASPAGGVLGLPLPLPSLPGLPPPA